MINLIIDFIMMFIMGYAALAVPILLGGGGLGELKIAFWMMILALGAGVIF